METEFIAFSEKRIKVTTQCAHHAFMCTRSEDHKSKKEYLINPFFISNILHYEDFLYESLLLNDTPKGFLFRFPKFTLLDLV